MTETLSSSARRVQEALAASGVACRVMEFPASTRTAEEAAQAVGCQVGQIVKSLVFRGKESGRGIFVMASGANRVNEKRLGELAGEKITKADAAFVREQTGFAIGGVAPVGHLTPMLTFVDEDLFRFGEIWAAAGTPNAVFRLTPDELVTITSGQKTAIV